MPIPIPHNNPTQGLPDTNAPQTPKKAANRIIPSRAMFTTPAFSEIKPPKAANRIGAAKSNVCVMESLKRDILFILQLLLF